MNPAQPALAIAAPPSRVPGAVGKTTIATPAAAADADGVLAELLVAHANTPLSDLTGKDPDVIFVDAPPYRPHLPSVHDHSLRIDRLTLPLPVPRYVTAPPPEPQPDLVSRWQQIAVDLKWPDPRR